MPTTVTKYSARIPSTEIIETKTTVADNGEITAEASRVIACFADYQAGMNYLATLTAPSEAN